MELTFNSYGNAVTTTASGKKAEIYRNETNLVRQCYAMYVDGKRIFSRGSIQKVYETLRKM